MSLLALKASSLNLMYALKACAACVLDGGFSWTVEWPVGGVAGLPFKDFCAQGSVP